MATLGCGGEDNLGAQEARVCGKIRSGTESSSDEVHNSDGETCESFSSVSHILQDFGGGGELGTITANDCRDEFRRTSGCRPNSVGCITQGPFKGWKDHFGRKCVVRHTEEQFQQEGMMAGTAAIDKVMHKESTWCSSARVGLWRSLLPVCSRLSIENITRIVHTHTLKENHSKINVVRMRTRL